jgi:hypothetical protein
VLYGLPRPELKKLPDVIHGKLVKMFEKYLDLRNSAAKGAEHIQKEKAESQSVEAHNATRMKKHREHDR